jgi:hypothetical protein
MPSLEINYAMFTSNVSKDTCKDMNISNKSELIICPERTQTTCNPLCTYRLMIHETKKLLCGGEKIHNGTHLNRCACSHVDVVV